MKKDKTIEIKCKGSRSLAMDGLSKFQGILKWKTTGHPTEMSYLAEAEMKAICGFPQDYVLLGSLSKRATMLGNSVMPPMMAAIAGLIKKTLEGIEYGIK